MTIWCFREDDDIASANVVPLNENRASAMDIQGCFDIVKMWISAGSRAPGRGHAGLRDVRNGPEHYAEAQDPGGAVSLSFAKPEL